MAHEYKNGKALFPFLSAVSWKSLKGTEGQRISSIFPVSCPCCSSTGSSMRAKSLTWSTQCERNVPFRKHVTPFVWFPCLRCSPLRSSVLNTQFTQVAIAQWKQKKSQPWWHVAENTIIIRVHVGEHGVWVCIFNMLCAINVYSEPNRHWQS